MPVYMWIAISLSTERQITNSYRTVEYSDLFSYKDNDF